ncbi:MAG: HigA family addiction module antidote protein [Sphingomonadales bacterium]|nr:HigA family addiction module antidote protein [Sphingomonadales bacterium]
MAIKTGMKPVHPGEFIRQAILPDELTVTDAAQILGVGRPALSTLLNGKASLSPEMALRLEKAFGVKMDTLLRMQARYDAAQIQKNALLS